MTRSGRTIVIMSILIAQATAGIAQPSPRFGVKAGLTVATTNETTAAAILGFVGGGSVVHSFSNVVAIQPEILFTMKGRKSDEVIPNLGTLHSEIRFYYFELPVLARISLPTEGNLKLHLLGGPFVALNVETAKRTDLGLTLGGSIDFDLEQVALSADLRYSLSLKDGANITTTVTDAAGNTVYRNSRDIKNRVLSLMVGAYF